MNTDPLGTVSTRVFPDAAVNEAEDTPELFIAI
jgi:hypothetical protein